MARRKSSGAPPPAAPSVAIADRDWLGARYGKIPAPELDDDWAWVDHYLDPPSIERVLWAV